MSTRLYHGSSAKERVYLESDTQGVILGVYGEEGLKTQEAKEIVDLVLGSFVGDRDGIIIIGPMDDANPKASDTLLKIIEEEPSSCRLNLWAHDIGEVSKTIKSRCIPVWCQSSFTDHDGEDLSESVSRSYIQALLAGRYYELHDILSQYKEKDMSLLSHSIADALWADAANPKALRIWNRIRPLMGKSHTSKLELISVCL